MLCRKYYRSREKKRGIGKYREYSIDAEAFANVDGSYNNDAI
jgi:hypothetical protein